MGLRHDGGADGGLRVVRVSAAEVDECKNVVCGGASQCIDGVGTFTCECAPGWQVFSFLILLKLFLFLFMYLLSDRIFPYFIFRCYVFLSFFFF